MSSPFVAEIRIVGFNFAPRGWATCDGQLLPISQNTALFSLLGTTYGGDGKSNFGLPNLQGSAPMQPGQGAGLSLRFLGETSGTPSVTLLATEMPQHNHNVVASQADGIDQGPGNSLLASGIAIGQYAPPPTNTTLSPTMLAVAGGNLPHNNMMPFITMLFIIAMQGIFPARN